jgi:hypothetical protein
MISFINLTKSKIGAFLRKWNSFWPKFIIILFIIIKMFSLHMIKINHLIIIIIIHLDFLFILPYMEISSFLIFFLPIWVYNEIKKNIIVILYRKKRKKKQTIHFLLLTMYVWIWNKKKQGNFIFPSYQTLKFFTKKQGKITDVNNFGEYSAKKTREDNL